MYEAAGHGLSSCFGKCSVEDLATCWYYILSGSVLIAGQLFLNGMRYVS